MGSVVHFRSEFFAAKEKSPFLMIVLHGKGDRIRPFRSLSHDMQLPFMNYLMLEAPKKFMNGFSWYGDPPYQKMGVLKVREKMFEVLDQLKQQGWKSENIFFLGFSQGCLVSADIGLNYPERLGGVVGISGYFQFYPRWKAKLAKNKGTPWMFTHGHKDDVLPIETTKYGVFKLRDAGLNVDWIESDKKHTFDEDEYPIIRDWILQQVPKSRFRSLRSAQE